VSPSGPANTFTFNGGLTSAHVKPPDPFSGTGSFASSSSGNRWTGPLTVDFPGDPNASLPGNGFVAFLQHATSF
jgi:hypothetical protein